MLLCGVVAGAVVVVVVTVVVVVVVVAGAAGAAGVGAVCFGVTLAVDVVELAAVLDGMMLPVCYDHVVDDEAAAQERRAWHNNFIVLSSYASLALALLPSSLLFSLKKYFL